MEDLTKDLMSMEFHGTHHQRGCSSFPQTPLVTFVSQDARKNVALTGRIYGFASVCPFSMLC